MSTWYTIPEIVGGTLHKVISTSHKHIDHKPITAEITVLYEDWIHARSFQKSKTFHIILEADGNYHYHWESQGRDKEDRAMILKHDHIVKAGFVLTGSKEN